MASGRVRTRGRLHPSHGEVEGEFFAMKNSRIFSIARFRAMLAKEFIQMRRDRLTFAMMIGVPLLQLVLFGYAINSDPKHLPTAVYSADNSVFSRTIVWAMRNSSYFDVTSEPSDEAGVQELLAKGK